MLEILKVLSDYGWQGLAVAGAAVILYKMISAKISKITDEKQNKNQSDNSDDDSDESLFNQKLDIRKNAFFNAVEYTLAVRIPTLDLYKNKPVRQLMLRDLMLVSVKSFRDSVADSRFVAVEDSEILENMDWPFEALKLFNNIPIRIKQDLEAHGFPPALVDNFYFWYTNRLVTLKEYIQQVSITTEFNTNKVKTLILLQILQLFITTLMGDAEIVLRQLNGQLTGKQYKGKTVEDA